MRESRSYGSVGEQGDNELLYPECESITYGSVRGLGVKLPFTYSTAFCSPDNFVISYISLCSQLQFTYLIFCTVTNPAAETKSIGLQADAQ